MEHIKIIDEKFLFAY